MSCDTQRYEIISFWVLLCLSVVSLLGCAAIVIVYAFFKPLRTFSLKIVLYMTISDILRSVIFIYPVYHNKTSLICSFFAYIRALTYVISIYWSFCISFILYQTITKFKDNFERNEKYWVFTGFVIIPLCSIPPFFTHSYEYNYWTRDLKEDTYGQVYRACRDFVPIYLARFTMIYMYFKIYYHLKRLELINFKELLLEKGFIYPVIIILSSSLLLPLRVGELFYNECELFVFSLICYAFFGVHGIFNFIALMLNPNFRRGIRRCLRMSSTYTINEASSEEDSLKNMDFN